MEHTPSQQELDELEESIQRTRDQVRDDRVPPSIQEAERRHEEGQDLMPRSDDGNPM